MHIGLSEEAAVDATEQLLELGVPTVAHLGDLDDAESKAVGLNIVQVRKLRVELDTYGKWFYLNSYSTEADLDAVT